MAESNGFTQLNLTHWSSVTRAISSAIKHGNMERLLTFQIHKLNTTLLLPLSSKTLRSIRARSLKKRQEETWLKMSTLEGAFLLRSVLDCKPTRSSRDPLDSTKDYRAALYNLWFYPPLCERFWNCYIGTTGIIFCYVRRIWLWISINMKALRITTGTNKSSHGGRNS